MSKEKSLVEDTFIQMKNLEEVISENAKGILSSTMKEEIKSLVKESLNEQDDEEIEVDAELEEPVGDEEEADNEEDMEMDFEDEMDSDEEEMDFEDDMDMDFEDEPIDLTNASDEEILKVFKAMSDEDGIIVKKEDDMIHLSDDEDEYLIQLGESYEEEEEEEEEEEDLYEEDEMEMDFEEELEESEDDEEELDEEVIYELELDDEDLEEESDDEEDLYEDFTEDDIDMMFSDEELNESKSFKAKGIGMGNASKFKYGKKPNMDKGFDVKKKQGTRGVGMGKAKFEYKEEVNSKGVEKPKVKKEETKEASRTYGNGSKSGRGLRKAITPNRNLTFENTSNEELTLLREKNEEYRKALNVFRTKLNEVAVFNSNLAYATRLFTEHSTTKQEKINILRRFDGVESLKESKTLYKTIKDELTSSKGGETTITESFERAVEKTPVSGSASTLIESKTYENPQFLRMKDLMTKIK